jgi:hypothetical protein
MLSIPSANHIAYQLIAQFFCYSVSAFQSPRLRMGRNGMCPHFEDNNRLSMSQALLFLNMVTSFFYEPKQITHFYNQNVFHNKRLALYNVDGF